MSEVLPRFSGDLVTVSSTTSAAVTGGQLVYLTADRTVAPTIGAGGCSGVALYDQPVVGGNVDVAKGGVFYLTASVAVTAGAYVAPAAGGQIALAVAPDRGIGYVEQGAAATGQALVRLFT